MPLRPTPQLDESVNTPILTFPLDGLRGVCIVAEHLKHHVILRERSDRRI